MITLHNHHIPLSTFASTSLSHAKNTRSQTLQIQISPAMISPFSPQSFFLTILPLLCQNLSFWIFFTARFRFNSHSLDRLQQFAMVKNTQKRRAEPKPVLPSKSISKERMRLLIRSNLSRNQEKSKVKSVLHHKITELLSESMLECPICLQLFLKPVLAECGHIFCLTCAEDLAKNDYPCGICHDNEPTYDLTVYHAFQALVNAYLHKCTPEEAQAYEKRSNQLQEKESKREIGKLSKGDFLDFWCLDQRCWKSGVVEDISSEGIVLLTELKRSKCVQINILSRRLARYRYYTKEEPTSFGIINRFDSPVPTYARTVNHSGMFGMPMFINLFGSQDRSQPYSAFDGSDYFSFMPQYRPFSF